MIIGDCEVWITCDNEQSPEYRTGFESNDNKTIACFIPSEAGKNFVIHCRNSFASDYLRCRFMLDGSDGSSMDCGHGKKRSKWGIRTSRDVRRPYQFANLATTDVDYGLHAPATDDLGVIKVTVWHVRYVLGPQPSDQKFCDFKPVGLVHERSKKVGTHCVSLGEGVRVEPRYEDPSWHSQFVDPGKGPVGIFIFRYRPIELLRAQGIAPQITEPRHNSVQADSSQREDVPIPPDDNGGQTGRKRAGSYDRDADGEEIKRTRRLDSEADVKENMVDSSDDEDELGMLKNQLSQIMSRLDRIEKKKKHGRKLGIPVGKLKKEEPHEANLGPSGSAAVIDLTLSD